MSWYELYIGRIVSSDLREEYQLVAPLTPQNDGWDGMITLHQRGLKTYYTDQPI